MLKCRQKKGSNKHYGFSFPRWALSGFHADPPGAPVQPSPAQCSRESHFTEEKLRLGVVRNLPKFTPLM